MTFTASGHQTFVLTAYTLFLQQLQDADDTEEQPRAQALPHFRAKPAGTC